MALATIIGTDGGPLLGRQPVPDTVWQRAGSPVVVAGLTNGTPYTFTVPATNNVVPGAPSAPSLAATPISVATVPDAPTSVMGTRGNGQVTVTFTVPGDGGSAITGYTVTALPGGATGSGTGSPIVVAGLTNGTSYTFTVTATNSVGTSAASSASAAVTPATVPGAPTNVFGRPDNGQVRVSFDAPSSSGGAAVTSYTVTASPGGATASGSASSIVVTGLTNGTSYTFTAIATNGVGSGAASAASAAVTPNVSTLTVAPATLVFTATQNGVRGPLNNVTAAQEVTVAFAGPAQFWTATVNQPWVHLYNGVLFGPALPILFLGNGLFSVSISDTTNAIGAATNLSATITISAPSAGLSTTVGISLQVMPNGTSSPPFGQVDTPVQNAAGVQGAIGVTGWALDDVGVASVKIYRNCLPVDAVACQSISGHSVVYIGDAAFVPGARSDIETAFATSPQSYRGGWGYLMLTNMLPNLTSGLGYGGQGPLTIYAFATDMEGNRTLLGRSWSGDGSTSPTSITMANASIFKPFGAIDTPGQGQRVSGTIPNFGWALTPDSNASADGTDVMVPTNGSTMQVVIDGAAVGTVRYNQCRGTVGNPVPAGLYCDDDVANIFGNPTPQSTGNPRSANPTRFRNLDAGRAAIGSFDIDTRLLTNGRHSIAWGVTDSAGRAEGIGSRDFLVFNGSSLMASRMASAMVDDAAVVALGRTADLDDRAVSETEVWGRTGFDFTRSTELVAPNADGVRHVTMPEQGRLELWLGEDVTAGYLKANADLRPLPPGSQLDTATGRFTWGPLVGYIGAYDLVFLDGDGQIPIRVTLHPTSSETTGLMRAYIDSPAPLATVSGPLTVAGWALDTGAWHGSGVGAVHVWAQRVDTGAVPAVFLGAADLGAVRPDVAAAFGAEGERTGWQLAAAGLPPGLYDVTAYFWSTRTDRFEDARTVRITVR